MTPFFVPLQGRDKRSGTGKKFGLAIVVKGNGTLRLHPLCKLSSYTYPSDGFSEDLEEEKELRMHQKQFLRERRKHGRALPGEFEILGELAGLDNFQGKDKYKHDQGGEIRSTENTWEWTGRQFAPSKVGFNIFSY